MTTVILRSYSALSWLIINNPGANVNHSVEVCRNFTETIKKSCAPAGFSPGPGWIFLPFRPLSANNLKVPGAGFGVDTNVVTIITAQGATELPLQSKDAVAGHIADAIAGK